jgi:hypothetical protein
LVPIFEGPYPILLGEDQTPFELAFLKEERLRKKQRFREEQGWRRLRDAVASAYATSPGEPRRPRGGRSRMDMAGSNEGCKGCGGGVGGVFSCEQATSDYSPGDSDDTDTKMTGSSAYLCSTQNSHDLKKHHPFQHERSYKGHHPPYYTNHSRRRRHYRPYRRRQSPSSNPSSYLGSNDSTLPILVTNSMPLPRTRPRSDDGRSAKGYNRSFVSSTRVAP